LITEFSAERLSHTATLSGMLNPGGSDISIRYTSHTNSLQVLLVSQSLPNYQNRNCLQHNILELC
jgi:hypothetical protein